ncbi:MAG: hypothetical protein LBP33_06205 [Candidatus Adiutrix sp.]|jgi:hypothetical protein|nr:hypothetical protein [Candidatus Adiutrix sp.]
MDDDQDRIRVWAKLDELKTLQVKTLAVLEEREKFCARHEACLTNLKERVRKLEIDLAKYAGLSALISSALTAAVVKIFVG